MSAQHLSLFKRANGVWYVCYEHQGRRRWKSTGSTTKQGALTFLTEFNKDEVKTYSRMRFSEFVKHYADLHGYAIRPTTLKRVMNPVFGGFISICGDKELDRYSVQDVEHYKAARLRKVTPTSVNIAFRSLKAAFDLAIKWRMATENPLGILTAPCRSSNKGVLHERGIRKTSFPHDRTLAEGNRGVCRFDRTTPQRDNPPSRV